MSFGCSRSSSSRWIVGSALGAMVIAFGCIGPDSFFRDGGGASPPGSGGAFGSGGIGVTGSGGEGVGGTGTGGQTGTGGRGIGGAPGTGGRTGVGGSGTGGAPGAGGSSMGGRTGTGGSGMGGAPGVGGSAAGGSGAGGAIVNDGGAGGAGGCPPGIYCDDFEADTATAVGALNAVPVGWTRVGGSNGEWGVRPDTTKTFAQDGNNSSTHRICYASAAPGAPWSGATTASAQIKLTAAGSSGATTAMLCLRYTMGTGAYCVALMENMGAQLQVRNGQSISSMATLVPSAISLGMWHAVQISVDGSGVISGSLDGAPLGTLTPASAINSGYVSVATQSAEAAFDNVVVSQP